MSFLLSLSIIPGLSTLHYDYSNSKHLIRLNWFNLKDEIYLEPKTSTVFSYIDKEEGKSWRLIFTKKEIKSSDEARGWEQIYFPYSNKNYNFFISTPELDGYSGNNNKCFVKYWVSSKDNTVSTKVSGELFNVFLKLKTIKDKVLRWCDLSEIEGLYYQVW